MSNEPAALEARGLVMRCGRRHPVLRDCSFRLPAGRICALGGPSGTGKSTLPALVAGMLRPTQGTLRVLGAGPAESRPRIGYVAQTRPLDPQLTVAAPLRLGAELNPGRWDQEAAERAAYGAGLDPKARIRTLSGGQRTRVALAPAFGKRTELLPYEPVADLDPVARHQLVGALLAVAVEHGTSILMSSHVLAELQGACDYLLLLGRGQIRLAGESEDVPTAHARLTSTSRDFAPATAVESGATGRGHTAPVRPQGPVDAASWLVEQPSVRELILAHLHNPGAVALFTGSASPAPSQEAVA